MRDWLWNRCYRYIAGQHKCGLRCRIADWYVLRHIDEQLVEE